MVSAAQSERTSTDRTLVRAGAELPVNVQVACCRGVPGELAGTIKAGGASLRGGFMVEGEVLHGNAPGFGIMRVCVEGGIASDLRHAGDGGADDGAAMDHRFQNWHPEALES